MPNQTVLWHWCPKRTDVIHEACRPLAGRILRTDRASCDLLLHKAGETTLQKMYEWGATTNPFASDLCPVICIIQDGICIPYLFLTPLPPRQHSKKNSRCAKQYGMLFDDAQVSFIWNYEGECIIPWFVERKPESRDSAGLEVVLHCSSLQLSSLLMLCFTIKCFVFLDILIT